MADGRAGESVANVIAFRVDASLQIGSGHVMRCITLANVLRQRGSECHFICREHPGHLLDHVRELGFFVHPLQVESVVGVDRPRVQGEPKHAAWLGSSWHDDAVECRDILQAISPDWLVVDHYALDSRWESVVKPTTTRLLVIDDLADRPHIANLLLDQSLGRSEEDYSQLLPENCGCLVGPQYALLRPEFARLREASLARRQFPRLRHLLITMGGVDKDNATGQVLSALCNCRVPEDCRVSVVMGGGAPWIDQVKSQAASMPWLTEVLVDINDMGKKMAAADLSIGAAGSTSWERCCLGLPALTVVLADNQEGVADALDATGAAVNLGRIATLPTLGDRWPALTSPEALSSMSQASALVTAGNGAALVLEAMQREMLCHTTS